MYCRLRREELCAASHDLEAKVASLEEQQRRLEEQQAALETARGELGGSRSRIQLMERELQVQNRPAAAVCLVHPCTTSLISVGVCVVMRQAAEALRLCRSVWLNYVSVCAVSEARSQAPCCRDLLQDTHRRVHTQAAQLEQARYDLAASRYGPFGLE